MPFQLPAPTPEPPMAYKAVHDFSPGHISLAVEKTYFFSFPRFGLDSNGNPTFTPADSPTLDPVFDSSVELDRSSFYSRLLEWSPSHQTDPVLNLVKSTPTPDTYVCKYEVHNELPAITNGFRIKGNLVYPPLSRTTLSVRFIGDSKRIVDASKTVSSVLFGDFPLEVIVGANISSGNGRITPSSIQPIKVYNPNAISGQYNFGDFTGYFYSKVLSGIFFVREIKE